MTSLIGVGVLVGLVVWTSIYVSGLERAAAPVDEGVAEGTEELQ